MIGYVKIYKPELKLKELTLYNAYYCGICKALGDRYGLVYRNALNYDTVFLAVLADCFNNRENPIETFRCVLHPIKKKPRCVPSATMDAVADITVFLSYHKLLDDKNDDDSFWSGIGSSLIKGGYSKSKYRIGETAVRIESFLDRLHELEKSGTDDIDSVSDCYASIIRDTVKYMVDAEKNVKDAASWIGYNIGKWIYILDAVDDISDDRKTGSYNPVIARYPWNQGEDVKDYLKRIRESISFILFTGLEEASATFDLIDKNINSGIIKNILYEGMFDITNKILNGEAKYGGKQSI
jgi:hypothetical protein